MYFDDEFIKSLPEDWPSAILKIDERFRKLTETPQVDHTEVTEELLVFLSIYLRKVGIDVAVATPQGTSTDMVRSKTILNDLRASARVALHEQSRKARIAQHKSRFEIAIDGTFHYELSEGDLRRIQTLVNELRDIISASQELEEAHKQRVLRRLEKLQSELHKKISDFSWFWGELIEASIAIRIIGENAKPAIDILRELVGIIWPVQTRAFDLPSNVPFKLPGQTDSES